MPKENRTKTLQEKIEILSKDFLDRDGETFTYEKKEGRLNWENRVSTGGSYSEFVLHPKSNEELITNAYKIATDMVTVMDTPFKVNVNITGSQSCTNSKELYVATKVFDDPDLSVGQKLDTFIGFTVHEGCHLLYTNFNCKLMNKLEATLQNIIEDERIERELGNNKPGLVNFLKAAKYYLFDKYKKDIDAKGGFDKLGLSAKVINAVLAYIRYPKALSATDISDYSDVLIKVREALIPYPDNDSEVKTAAKKIKKAIEEFLKDKNQEQQNNKQSQKPQQSQQGAEQQESQDNTQNNPQTQMDNTENNSGENSSSSESQEEQEKQEQNKECSGGPGSSESKQSNSGKSKQQIAADVSKDIEDAVKQMSDALSQIAQDPSNILQDSDKSDTILQENGKVGEICSGNLERGNQKGTYIHTAKDNKMMYEDSLKRIKPHIPAVSKVLRLSSTDYKLCLRGMRSGVLDTGKLAEAFQGVPTVYMREGEVKTDRCSVCMLIDESGSMYGSGESYARDTAILLNEAIKKISNVDLYIYGHTATKNNVDLFVYREKNIENKYALGSTESRAGNKDSIAIREVCSRVRKHTKDRCLFFMISDGAPNEGVDEVRKAVKAVEKDNFSVVAISIDPYYDPSLMYSKNVTLKNMSTLAVEVGKLVKKAVLENNKKQITM